MSSEFKVALLAAGVLGLLAACAGFRWVASAGERVAQPVPWSALPPTPPPPALPPPDYSKLVTAKALAAIALGAAKPTKASAKSGITAETYADPPVEATREKAVPDRVRITMATAPPEGLGPGEKVCVNEASDTEYGRITSGPLAGKYLVRVGALMHLMTESYLRHFDFDSCALGPSCKSGRDLARPLLTKERMEAVCQSTIRKTLKAPSRAEFPEEEGTRSQVVIGKDCSLLYVAYVDSPNSFNAMLRAGYTCTWSPETDVVHATLVEK